MMATEVLAAWRAAKAAESDVEVEPGNKSAVEVVD